MHKPTLALLLALSATAAAAPHDDAQAHVKAATAAYESGAFDTALSELQAAYAIEPQPELLYAIGQAFSRLGKCTDATASFEQFRGTTTDPDVAKVVDQAIAACKPSDTVAPITPTPTEPLTGSAAGSGSAAPVEHELPPPPPVAPAAGAWYTDALGDGLVGAGLAATIVGAVVYHTARGKLDDAEASSTLPVYDNLVADAHSERTLSVVLLAGGGALVVGGIIRYALRGADEHAPASGLTVAPTAHGGVLTWLGRF